MPGQPGARHRCAVPAGCAAEQRPPTPALALLPSFAGCSYFDQLGPVVRRVPYMTTVGNHEVGSFPSCPPADLAMPVDCLLLQHWRCKIALLGALRSAPWMHLRRAPSSLAPLAAAAHAQRRCCCAQSP